MAEVLFSLAHKGELTESSELNGGGAFQSGTQGMLGEQ